ncbi:MAG: betaine/proline/choline family ABC transporter ATP-binding protein [Actinomycetota bacterium]
MIELEHVTKKYDGGSVAVDDLSLSVDAGELVVFVGPSGCGKTTTMKMVNRLIEPTSGRILIEGRDILAEDPVVVRRGIGYVIQQVGLFPHQTIAQNVATVPRLLGWDKTRIRNRVNELLELVGLPPSSYADRYPHQLSGGQRQRVGVARALGADPPVLLMDEPFGAIDPVTRNRLQQEFLRLQAELRKTVIFVTHDIEEAVLLGDRIAVLREGGVLEQYDTPADVLGRPATPFVASFVGSDRGLKRLSVTPIDVADLEHPGVIHLGESLADARRALGESGADWAIVLDDSEGLHGYVGGPGNAGDGGPGLAGEGIVADRAKRLPAWVPVNATLKRAFAEMLAHDAGWVAVLDGERYLGVLTPESLHSALRRSVAQSADDSVAAAPTH